MNQAYYTKIVYKKTVRPQHRILKNFQMKPYLTKLTCKPSDVKLGTIGSSVVIEPPKIQSEFTPAIFGVTEDPDDD